MIRRVPKHHKPTPKPNLASKLQGVIIVTVSFISRLTFIRKKLWRVQATVFQVHLAYKLDLDPELSVKQRLLVFLPDYRYLPSMDSYYFIIREYRAQSRTSALYLHLPQPVTVHGSNLLFVMTHVLFGPTKMLSYQF